METGQSGGEKPRVQFATPLEGRGPEGQQVFQLFAGSSKEAEEKFAQWMSTTAEGRKVVAALAAAELEQVKRYADEEIRKTKPTLEDRESRVIEYQVMANALHRLGMYTEEKIVRKRFLHEGDGLYVRTWSTRASEIWNAQIRTKHMVIGSVALVAALFIYELIASRTGWPTFGILINPAVSTGMEMESNTTVTRTRRAA